MEPFAKEKATKELPDGASLLDVVTKSKCTALLEASLQTVVYRGRFTANGLAKRTAISSVQSNLERGVYIGRGGESDRREGGFFKRIAF